MLNNLVLLMWWPYGIFLWSTGDLLNPIRVDICVGRLDILCNITSLWKTRGYEEKEKQKDDEARKFRTCALVFESLIVALA